MVKHRHHDAEMTSAPDPAPPSMGVVKSAGRALQLLEFFEDIRRPARAVEAAAALGMPQSSSSMLLRSLRELGYLDYDPATRTYLPSPRVALLGSWLDAGPVRDGRVTRLLEHLNESYVKTTFLAARNSIFAQYIYMMPARSTMRFHVATGARRLLVGSAAGRALLTDAPDDEISRLHRRTAAEFPDFRLTLDQVMENVAAMRAQGHFLSRALVTEGAAALAIRLPRGIDKAGRPIALAMAGLLDEFERREAEFADVMKDAAARFLDDRY